MTRCDITYFFVYSQLDSTFIDGLLPVLKKFSKSELLSSIVPGRLFAARTPLRKGLELRISAAGFGRHSSTDDGLSGSREESSTSISHKILARRGSQVQEVSYRLIGMNSLLLLQSYEHQFYYIIRYSSFFAAPNPY
jgi:hypothetical protein